MTFAAAMIYVAGVAVWIAVLATVIVAFVRSPRTFGAIRLLLTPDQRCTATRCIASGERDGHYIPDKRCVAA